jgi:hypothetical protein
LSTVFVDFLQSFEHNFLSMTKVEKNPHAVALGKLGGAKGGRVRAQRQTPEQRKELARKAALARWSKGSTNKKTK